METARTVRGRLSNSRHIELDEPVSEMDGEVEIVLHRVVAQSVKPDEFGKTVNDPLAWDAEGWEEFNNQSSQT